MAGTFTFVRGILVEAQLQVFVSLQTGSDLLPAWAWIRKYVFNYTCISGYYVTVMFIENYYLACHRTFLAILKYAQTVIHELVLITTMPNKNICH